MKITFSDILDLIEYELLAVMFFVIGNHKVWLIVTAIFYVVLIIDYIVKRKELKKDGNT